MKVNKDKVQLLMARKQLSANEVAVRCNRTKQRISGILNSKNVTPKTVGMLAKALEVDPVEIIED